MLRSGLLSAFILTTFSRPAHAAATPSSTESSTWHGRLEAAEKATRTGCFHLSTSDSKFASPISMIGPLSGFVFISSAAFQIYERGVCDALQRRRWAWLEGLDKWSAQTHSFRTSPLGLRLPGEEIAFGSYLPDVLHGTG